MKKLYQLMLLLCCFGMMSTASINAQCAAPTTGGGTADPIYTMNMYDTFGDSWNGNEITITDNTGTVLGVFSMASNECEIQSFTVPIGTTSITISGTTDGGFTGEVEFEIFNGNGNAIYGVSSDISSTGVVFPGGDITTFTETIAVSNPDQALMDASCVAYNISLGDTFGDGWNDGFLTALVTNTDGSMQTYVYSVYNPDTPCVGTTTPGNSDYSLFIEAGATVEFFMTSGGFATEELITITEIATGTAIVMEGPSPTNGSLGSFVAACPAPFDGPVGSPGVICETKSSPLIVPTASCPVPCSDPNFIPEQTCSGASNVGLIPDQVQGPGANIPDVFALTVNDPASCAPAGSTISSITLNIIAEGDIGFAATETWTVVDEGGTTVGTSTVGVDCAGPTTTSIPVTMAQYSAWFANGNETFTASEPGGVDSYCGNSTIQVSFDIVYLDPALAGMPTVTWWTSEIGGTQIGEGESLDDLSGLTLGLGTTTVFAQCDCGPTEVSTRTPISITSVDCSCADGGCNYVLVMTDSGDNGWDGASLDVSVGEGASTNYKITAQEGCQKITNICVQDGELLDLQYWNGAFESEHGFTLYDYSGDIVTDITGTPINYSGNIPANTLIRAKAECPFVPCIDGTEDFTVRITMGQFPEEQSWEIYDGQSSTTAQGAQVISINATVYTGLAPGFQINYPVTLNQCNVYTFVGFDGFNDGWNGGTWELITANLNYGTEILNPFDINYGESLVLGPVAPAADETRTEFTIPCENSCEEVNVVDASTATCVTGTPVVLPIIAPIVCYPDCYHAEGCDLTVQHTVLAEGLNGGVFFGLAYGEISGSVVTGTGAVFPTSATFDGDAGFGPGILPVGCHKYVTEYTYCDGVVVKCTADLNIVTETNPSMTCNDNVIVSLAAPSSPNGEFTLGECIVRVTPDMVMEMPATNCFGIFEEYKVTVIGADGQPVVQLGPNGLPLDVAGNEIPAEIIDRDPANNLVGPEQLMETLTYVVEHKFSGNKCWGTITVEDKIAPVINCVNYDVPCTHPEALNEFWSHTDVYTPSMEMPANIAGGTAGLQSNTFIPVNFDCAPMGEIIQNIQVNLNLTHNDVTDLSVVLHIPAALDAWLLANVPGFTGSPLALDATGDVGAVNVYTPNPANDAPSLLALLGAPCMLTPSTSAENFITENSGNQVPANAGGTWYIQVIDNNATFPAPPFGGGEISAASITLTCGFPFPYAAFDCSLEGVELIDEAVVETGCDQSDWNGSVIERVWQATDKFGRTSVCTQTVGLKAPTMDQIAKPGDISIECGTELLAEDGSVDPAQSGGPRFSCFEITEEQHGLCDISYTYEDQVLGTCGNGYKVIRTWTIVNWCSGVNKTHQQTIKVEDTEGPSIAQEDVAGGTDPYDCVAGTVSLEDLGIEDNCSGVSSVTATYTQGGGSYIGGGQLTIINLLTSDIEDLPMGANQILITAKDGCLNVTEKLITITIADDTPPVAICDDELHVSLGGDGSARLFAEDVDEGSYDNCSEVTLEVRRTDGCLGTSSWGAYAEFACCDVDEFVTVELRVTDAAGNTNVCWKSVLVEDALAPVITAPADKTINCDDAAVHSPFGEATAIDNCTASIDFVDGGELDQCKAGTLTRTWTATDGSDKSADVSATQRVTVEHVSDFVVQFPSDVTISTCPDDLGATGEPSISDDDCELLAISSTDLVLNIVDDACYKIERTWTIINWCVYEQGSAATDLGFPQPLPRTYRDDDGYFQYVQTIKVLDNDAPTITNPGDQTFCDLTEGCEGQADLVLEATDGCSNDDALEYIYKIDEFNTGEVDIIGEGNDASGVYPYGTHSIKWIVEDGCGNTSSESYLFTVEDCKNPTPVCLNGISLPGMNSDGCVELWASDLLEYAFDNCSSDEFVENSVRIRREGATTAPQSVITLCCDTDGTGTILLEVWVEDEAGNADFCTTYAILQDPNGICGTDDSRMIAGDIGTEEGEMVEEVMVDINGNNGMSNALPTGVNGHYAFPNLVTGVDYTVTPVKDVNPTNGVSTYDLVLMSQHILGVNELTSPYALIAADVNNDGNVTTFDVVQNRQLILYVITDFPSNTSWRFVDADYTFPVTSNPWMESFPEAITVNNLTTDEMTTDFVAIKVGDVNGDAVVNSILGTEDRNKVGTLNLEVEDAKVAKGNTVSVDFRASDFASVNGYQFTMNFDASAMNLAGVEKGALNVTESNFGLSMLNEGVITTSWNAASTSVAKDAVLFTLNFDITNEVVLSEALSISSRYTVAEAYAGNDLMDVALVFNTENGTVAGTTFELYQNTPNPFNGETVIGFSLPTASQATLTVMDVSGRVLNVVEGDFAKGYNTINLNSSDLNAAGVLYYQLETASNSATMKMIILE